MERIEDLVDFSGHEELGRGSYAVVFKARLKAARFGCPKDTWVAVKQIDLSRFPEAALQTLKKEIEVLQKIRNLNVLSHIVCMYQYVVCFTNRGCF